MRRARVRVTVAAVIAAATGLLGMVVTASAAHATYAGHDGKIAFVRHDQIYTIRPDGSGLRQLTTSGDNLHPTWSPHGQRIAYVHTAASGATDVWVMSATGADKTQVTHVGNATEPTWSPDGNFLAFGGGTPLSLEKVRSTAPFGAPRVLMAYETNDECGDEQPSDAHRLNVDRFVAWSPDGSRIAVYNHDDCQLDDSIFMYYPATGEARQYAAIGGSCCGEADWSDLTWGPAGQFGYASVDFSEQPRQPSTIVYPGYAGKPGDTAPAPDPSGAKLALANASSGVSKIFVQSVDGTHRTLVTQGEEPAWQAT